MLFMGLFLIALSTVLGIILASLLRLTVDKRPAFLSSPTRLIF